VGGHEVVAPVDGTERVAVNVDGLIWLLRADDAPRGWGVFDVCADQAVWLRAATPWERDEYAQRSYRFRATVFGVRDGTALALRPGDGATCLVRLASAVDLFDTVDVCYDGRCCWWLDTMSRDPTLEVWRAALHDGMAPHDKVPHAISRAYVRAWAIHQATRPTPLQDRLRRSLELAGATFLETRLHAQGTFVRWCYKNQNYETLVDPATLDVVSAGVCLSGRDADFDLTSLVSVMGERGNAPNYYEGY
jgi:hypothetical protein